MKEDGLAVARLTRAYPRQVHEVLVPYGASPEQVGEAVDLYKDSIKSETSFAADDTTGAITALQQALDYCDTIAEKTTQDSAYIGLCTASRKARQRIAHDPDHKRTRETLRVALCEAIARLAVEV